MNNSNEKAVYAKSKSIPLSAVPADKAHMSIGISIKRATNQKTFVIVFSVALLDYEESITVILK